MLNDILKVTITKPECRVCRMKSYKRSLCAKHLIEFDYFIANTNSIEVMTATDQVEEFVKSKNKDLLGG